MSSSIFVESTSVGTDPKNCVSESNLVVVYGKNGVSFDETGLECLLEDKKISSLSVIRLTSPTPSMEDEEEKVKDLQEMLRRQELGSHTDCSELDDEESFNAHASDEKSSNDGERYIHNKADEDSDNNQNEDFQKVKKPRRRGRVPNTLKQKILRKRSRKERPEIIGLRVEEFYPSEDADLIIKQALKIAGLGTNKKDYENFEFQLFVIRNDHCYTPYTSPTQMKAKLNADRLAANAKINIKSSMEKKMFGNNSSAVSQNEEFEESQASKRYASKSSNLRDKCQNQTDNCAAEELNITKSSNDENSENSCDELENSTVYCSQSGDSDNDRDSDLDFDVNNPKGRKRKVRYLKINKRPLQSSKVVQKPRKVPEYSAGFMFKANTPISQSLVPIERQKINDNSSAPLAPHCYIQARKPAAKTISPESTQNIPPTLPKVNTISNSTVRILDNSHNVQSTNSTHIKQLLEGPSNKQFLLQKKDSAITDHAKRSSNNYNVIERSKLVQPVYRTHKEFVLNNVISSPNSKGFTNLTKFINEAQKPVSECLLPNSTDNQFPNNNPTKTIIQQQFSNNFDCIGKNVSDSKEQGNRELETESDKQLDLINSIVQDELQNLSKNTTQPNISDIPELVKMLESTERTLDSRGGDKNEISGITLLNTTEANLDSDLTDDILQQVVELIQDDKKLQEAVDNQVFGNNDGAFVDSSKDNKANLLHKDLPPLAPISNQNNCNPSAMQELAQPSKSIIQMTISNVTPPSLISKEQYKNTIKSYPYQPVSKTLSIVRKEPIQIIRGNGRVITLPPIEAPTTRAKRRAQVQPPSGIQQANLNNSSPICPLNYITDTTPLSSSQHPNSSIISVKNISNTRKIGSIAIAQETTKVSSTKKTNAKRNSKKSHSTKVQTEPGNSDGGADDDDDPNKLWCVCRQPHNNRFMICCDMCEDWYHGTCVSITKAMGLEMEKNGIDWTCPKCLKKEDEKTQPRITDLFQKNQTTSRTNVEPAKACVDDSPPNLESQCPQFNVKSAETSTNPFERCTQQIEGAVAHQIDDKFVSSHISRNTVNEHRLDVTKINKQPIVDQQHQTEDLVPPAQSYSSSDLCIVCKRHARLHTIYCSDECIRKHAQNAISITMSKCQADQLSNTSISVSADEKIKKKSKGLFEDLLLMADRKPKIERIFVFERKSGRILTGNSAPTTINLKKWLQDNPTFEVIQPGSTLALDIERKTKQKPLNVSTTIMAKTTSVSPVIKTSIPNTIVSSPSMLKYVSSSRISKPTVQSTKPMTDYIKNSVTVSSQPSTSKYVQKTLPIGVKLEKTHNKTLDDVKPQSKDITTTPSGKNQVNNETTKSGCGDGGQSIRHVVRRTLKEQLLLRIQEENKCNQNEGDVKMDENRMAKSTLPKLSFEEIEDFAKATEVEMYNYFNKDTGNRYKAKYRSLVFNIKDRKNQTLFAKIYGKLIEPKQLVRMSPEEMASQELAQWREQETKHQLDIIKKSELDLLTCAKNYVLKTHKGEEVIEGKPADYANVDMAIPVEDVVSAINNSEVNQALKLQEQDNSPDNSLPTASCTKKKEETYSSHMEKHRDILSPSIIHHGKQQDHDKVKHHSRDSDRDRHHKSKTHRRDKPHSKKRSRSSSKSRSRERHEKRYKSSHIDNSKDLSRSKVRLECDTPNTNNNDKISVAPPVIENAKVHKKPEKSVIKSIESYNLVDKILESTKTVEEAANLLRTEEDKAIEGTKKALNNTSSKLGKLTPNRVDSEPQNVVTITDQVDSSNSGSLQSYPEKPFVGSTAHGASQHSDVTDMKLWTGNINMIDVASFQLSLEPMIGNSIGIGQLLSKELDVVGRIGPNTVWDYISKIKKSPNKEIVVLKLIPAMESEILAYDALYDYLDNRNRLGVIKSISSQIKDFYIYPLKSENNVPLILKPSSRTEIWNENNKPDLLLGIIVRVVGKRSVSVLQPNTSSTVEESQGLVKQVTNRKIEGIISTPPESPKPKKSRKSIISEDNELDIDAIIKGPIAKIQKSGGASDPLPLTSTDDNEPYSPGGSLDTDDIPLLPTKFAGNTDLQKTPEDDLKRKMDEINRQIAAQEMEIAGLLTGETTTFGSGSSSNSHVLANISIPSNLSQILASIKSTNIQKEPEFSTAPPPPIIGSLKESTTTMNVDECYKGQTSKTNFNCKVSKSPSRLANLSEAELLSMVPDDIIVESNITKAAKYFDKEPTPPGV